MGKRLQASLRFSIGVNCCSWLAGFLGASLEDLLGADSLFHRLLYFLFRGPQLAGFMLIDALSLPETRPARSLAWDFFEVGSLILFLSTNLLVWVVAAYFVQCIGPNRKALRQVENKTAD